MVEVALKQERSSNNCNHHHRINAKEYFESENILITNSDIYWTKNNIQDVKNFINKIDQCESYYLLLSTNIILFTIILN